MQVTLGLQEGLDAVIVDTAGRLQIDDRLMGELAAARKAIAPTDTLLVVDAMTGQEAATLVRAFNEAAPITGGSAVVCHTGSKRAHLSRPCSRALLARATCAMPSTLSRHARPHTRSVAASCHPRTSRLVLASHR